MRENVMILYASSKDIKSISARAKMTSVVRSDMISKGKEIKKEVEYNGHHDILFTDGSRIQTIQVGTNWEYRLRGFRATHLFMCEDIYELQNIDRYIKEVCIPMVVNKSMYGGISSCDRIFTFNVSGEKLFVDFYQKDIDESK